MIDDLRLMIVVGPRGLRATARSNLVFLRKFSTGRNVSPCNTNTWFSHRATKPQSLGDIPASVLLRVLVPLCEYILWLRPQAALCFSQRHAEAGDRLYKQTQFRGRGALGLLIADCGLKGREPALARLQGQACAAMQNKANFAGRDCRATLAMTWCETKPIRGLVQKRAFSGDSGWGVGVASGGDRCWVR